MSGTTLPAANVSTACGAFLDEVTKRWTDHLNIMVATYMNANRGGFFTSAMTEDEAVRIATEGRGRSGYMDDYLAPHEHIANLKMLADAALRSGQTHVQVSSNDFGKIAHYYK